MRARVLTAMSSGLMIGALIASSPASAFAQTSNEAADRLIEADCDRQVSGTKTFPFFQGVLDTVEDLNNDGKRTVCLAGTIINDDRPAPTGRGDEPAVLRIWEPASLHTPLVIRGNNADGSRSRVRMVRTATSNLDLGKLLEGVTSQLTLENLEFILDYQRPAAQGSTILALYADMQLRNIELRGVSNGASVLALYAYGSGVIADVDVRLVGTEGSSTALIIDGGGFESVRQVNVEGSGRTDLLRLRSGSSINYLGSISGSGIDDGIVLDDDAFIGHLHYTSLEAQGSGLEINGRGGVQLLGAASDEDVHGVAITACTPLKLERWGEIQSMRNVKFYAKRDC